MTATHSDTQDFFIERVADWVARFPILSVEDPVAQDDLEGMALATERFGQRVQLIGDDILVTSAERVARRAICSALAKAAPRSRRRRSNPG